MTAVTAGKTIYGLPTSNYTQGLIYNRKLFSEAALDPERPADHLDPGRAGRHRHRQAGQRHRGLGRLRAGNNGGWHFSSYIDAVGGSMVNNSGAAPVASFDNSDAVAILQALHNLRFTDHAMSVTQGLAWGTLQQQLAAGKLGMYIAAPDDIYSVIVPRTRATSATSAWARCPA